VVISPTTIERITEQPGVLSQLLKDRGVRHRGTMWHCCFHDDRTPSVSTASGKYHCFGCGKHLDAIAFVQEFHNIPFVEAVGMLCDDLGIPVENHTGVVSIERRKAAVREAERFVLWRERLLDSLAEYHLWNFRLYHALKHQIIHGQVVEEELGRALEQCEEAEQRYLSAEQARDVIRQTDECTLIQMWRRKADWAA
jgi:hypothetical protein